MKAMILAAGRGERMRPLTDDCPKPLLAAGGKPLIVWHLERLAGAGFTEVIINHAHLGTRLVSYIGTGRNFGLSISWSAEPPGALGTAGGIAQALPLLGEQPFLVMAGDIFCDWDVTRARAVAALLIERGDLAHLVMVPNPPHHSQGDFLLIDGRIHDAPVEPKSALLTFSGIGIYAPALFRALRRGEQSQLAPQLRLAMTQARVAGERHCGTWYDIGTPERLATLDRRLRAPHADTHGATAKTPAAGDV